MSFRIIHHEGSREELIVKITNNLTELHNEYSEDYEDGFWDEAIQRVIKQDFSNDEDSAEVLGRAINFLFKPVSDDWKLNAYHDLANKTPGTLRELFIMFMNGRNFRTGSAGFGGETTCGYLDAAEVESALVALQNYEPDEKVSWEKEFIDSLITMLTSLASKKYGDLYVMS